MQTMAQGQFGLVHLSSTGDRTLCGRETVVNYRRNRLTGELEQTRKNLVVVTGEVECKICIKLAEKSR